MGRHMERLLRFALKYPGYHTYGKDTATVRAVVRLEALGFIYVSRETRQFKLAINEDYVIVNRICASS